jgi:hypothetical protein
MNLETFASLIRLYDCPRLNEKYKGIISLPLALPKFELDNADEFWKIWDSQNETVRRQHIDRGADGIDGASMDYQQWNGIAMYEMPSVLKDAAWLTTVSKELADSQPTYLKSILGILPFTKVRSIRLWSNHKVIPAHYDGNLPSSIDGKMRFPTEIRLMLHDENPIETFYLTPANKYPPHTDIPLHDRYYVKLPNDTNTFAWNNEDYLHGADFNPKYKKILVVIKGWVHLGRLEELLDASLEKYPDFILREKND